MNKYLLTPDLEFRAHQSKVTAKVQFGEPNRFIWVPHSSVGEGSLTGAESLKAAHLVSSASSMQLS